MLKKIISFFQRKKPIETAPVKVLSDKDRLQGLFMKMHRLQKDGAMLRAKETQLEFKKLISEIQADKADPARSIKG